MELTKSYSYLEKSRYLNVILLKDLKNSLEEENIMAIQDSDKTIPKKSEEQTADEISFQLYIDAVREKKIPWNTFVKLMKDFYYTDLERLEHLNSMILMELTKSYSYLERSRYLNIILLNELKNSIQEDNVQGIIEKEPILDLQDSALINHESKEQFLTHKNLFPNDKRLEEDIMKNSHTHYKCDSCGKSFSNTEILKRHIHTIHESHKDYKCESCHKSFSRAYNLKIHFHTVHEGQKDYKCQSKCQSCGKLYSSASKLKRHIHIVHEGHKDYKCESCGKFFSQAGDLKRHIYTIHEGHRDYKCDSCSESFSAAHNLKRHIHIIHKGQNSQDSASMNHESNEKFNADNDFTDDLSKEKCNTMSSQEKNTV